LVVAIGIETLRGLAAAHERELDTGPAPVIHRDVSPSNILLGTNGTVKLTDFGLARAMDRASMTRPNVIKGKLAYCAPELITGAKPSPRTDVFSLGVVLWEALTQRRLFTGKSDLEVLVAVRKGDVPPVATHRDDLPSGLAEIVADSLVADPERRFQTAKQMARALAEVLRTSHAEAEPLGASVRNARVRMGKDPEPSLEPVHSSEALSVADLEPSEEVLTRTSERPKGLWQSEGPSVALPLTRKKS
jgi:serine/threonine-protein kinase